MYVARGAARGCLTLPPKSHRRDANALVAKRRFHMASSARVNIKIIVLSRNGVLTNRPKFYILRLVQIFAVRLSRFGGTVNV